MQIKKKHRDSPFEKKEMAKGISLNLRDFFQHFGGWTGEWKIRNFPKLHNGTPSCLHELHPETHVPKPPESHGIIPVLVIGGRDYIIPWKAIYTWYISGIYCQLGDYMLPTTFYKNLKNQLRKGPHRHLSATSPMELGATRASPYAMRKSAGKPRKMDTVLRCPAGSDRN